MVFMVKTKKLEEQGVGGICSTACYSVIKKRMSCLDTEQLGDISRELHLVKKASEKKGHIVGLRLNSIVKVTNYRKWGTKQWLRRA